MCLDESIFFELELNIVKIIHLPSVGLDLRFVIPKIENFEESRVRESKFARKVLLQNFK